MLWLPCWHPCTTRGSTPHPPCLALVPRVTAHRTSLCATRGSTIHAPLCHAWLHAARSASLPEVCATCGSLRPTGKSHEKETDLFDAVRKEASIRAKVDRGDSTPPGSGDPPGDWRKYFPMDGEFSRAKRPRGAASSYTLNRGSGWLPATSPTREQGTTTQGPAGTAARDLGEFGAPAAQAQPARPFVAQVPSWLAFATRGMPAARFAPCLANVPRVACSPHAPPPARKTCHAWHARRTLRPLA